MSMSLRRMFEEIYIGSLLGRETVFFLSLRNVKMYRLDLYSNLIIYATGTDLEVFKSGKGGG